MNRKTREFYKQLIDGGISSFGESFDGFHDHAYEYDFYTNIEHTSANSIDQGFGREKRVYIPKKVCETISQEYLT